MVKKILVLENHRQTLTVLRSLANAGYDPIVGYHDQIGEKFIQCSRYTKETWLHPRFDEGVKFIEALKVFLKRRNDIAYIFPVDDTSTRLLARDYNQISQLCGILMASPSATEICQDKGKTYKLVRDLNIPLPETSVVRNFADINIQVENIGYPFILKPKTYRGPLYGKKCIICNSPDELEKAFSKWPESYQELILQRKVLGFRHNCMFTTLKGKIVSYFEMKVYRTDVYDSTGRGVDCISVSSSEQRKKYCESLILKLDYSGIGCIQFLVNEEDRSSYFLEFNPRLDANCALPYFCGVDFPKQAIDIHKYVSGEIASLPQYSRDYRVGIRLHWLFGDVSGMLKAVTQRNISISQMIGWSLRILCLLCKTVHHTTWSWKDPLPTLILYKQELLNIIKNRLRIKL
jgi:biotin carboxylase